MAYLILRTFSVATLACVVVACGDDGAPTGSGGGTTTSSGGGEGGTTTTATGGAGQGGGAQGGGAQGGGAQGGASTGGAGQGGGDVGAPECTQDADCTLSSNCCECAGRPNGEMPPTCTANCLIDECASFGLAPTAKAECRAGRCVAPISCDEGSVVCASPSPVCGDGLAPIIVGGCYQGGCLPVLECDRVTDCAECDGAPKPACVVEASQMPTTHCVDVPSECATVDCSCVGPSVCVGSFDVCNEQAGTITCDCPTCLAP
jgi:hypothetical protein